MYTVSGVEVDVTADTALEARNRAVDEGQREGLRQLLRRLTAPESAFLLPDVATVDLSRLVRSFGVENEQLAADRYIGDVETTFDPEAVRDLLRGRNIPIILESGPPILVVPARQNDGQLALFDRDDPWTIAWGEGYDKNTLLDVVLPLGDLMDQSLVSARADPSALRGGLQALAERYNADAAVLLVAEGDPETDAPLTVSQRGAWNWAQTPETISVMPTDEPLRDWQVAVARSLQLLEEPWKVDNLVQFDQIDELDIVAPLVNLESWAFVARALDEAPEIQNVRLDAYSQTEARMRISFAGGLSQLVRSLGKRGLSLAEDSGGWQLLRSVTPEAG